MPFDVPAYKNLLHTWSLLEPELFKDWIECDRSLHSFIENRIFRKKDCDLHHRNYGENQFFSATVHHDGQSFGSDPWPTAGTALLFAYLRAIAQERPIESGSQWRHFKEGAIAHVDCYFSTNARRRPVPPEGVIIQRDYRLEADPEIVFTLFWEQDTGFGFSVDSEVDFGDIVFYHYLDSGGAWVREKKDFLALTGLAYPANWVAKLRFEEIGGTP